MPTLVYSVNQFRGAQVDREQLSSDPEEFRVQVEEALQEWQEGDLRLIWLEIPIEKARLIPIATEIGFTFHHANEDSLTLTYRVQTDAFVPTYATHCIGAGGVVLNDRRELLVVNERHRRDLSRPHYKLPGGALLAGEHLADAVVREVLEETGVQAKFESVVCFRHWHGYRWGKSDIYFICRLSPTSEAISIQEDEIEECLWMPVEEYLASEFVSVFNKRIVKAAIDTPGFPTTWVEGYADPSRYEFYMPEMDSI
jgi:8-oxo-dGTP pyrophosphatase MutT (NUDIX family)